MELYRLANNCDYGKLRDEMIRDRLVVGILDSSLSEQLQLDAELTLEKAKKKIRQREAVGQQQQELKGKTPLDAATVEAVNSRKPQKQRRKNRQPHPYPRESGRREGPYNRHL